MNANELRIGNMVYKSLKSGQGRTVINPIGCQDLVRIFEDIGSFNYAPIPITEDILLKCGFEKEPHMYHILISKATDIICKKDLRLDIDDDEWFADIVEYYDDEEVGEYSINIAKVKHLHQLQNLFFCLCGKELTIKL